MSFLKKIFNNYINGHHGGNNNHGRYSNDHQGSRSSHHGSRHDAPYYSSNSPVTKTCPYCQANIDAQSQFCGQCGKDTTNSVCRCGALIAPGAKFCGQCGASL
ncbi:zinc ribbon domain-containing protein [Legionella bozemanae]|uniref:zinc ribbon domain-containing protein n=1 Tax=Legionella bozemanae TaxID=447 RepID=UPI003EE9A356